MEERFGRVLEKVYACAAEPQRWRGALTALCGLFNCHFGDVFARTTDFGTYRGVAVGLDEHDYQHGLLDTWVKRNVWSAVHPVREAGHVVTTREMVDPGDLQRSEMYADYLRSRGLHEGLRFDLWAGGGWVQDISLMRAWSAGPFEAQERDAARLLLPHLQRAVAIARRLQEAEAVADAGFDALDALGQSVFLTDGNARVLRANKAAERMLARSGAVATEGAVLAGATPDATSRLRSLVGRAGQDGHDSGAAKLDAPGGSLSVLALPVAPESAWTGLRGPAVLVVAGPPARTALPAADHLARVFNLTAAEAEIAGLLAGGRSVARIAEDTGRSVNTVRTHVARIMTKAAVHRQADLVRKLLQAPPETTHGGPKLG